MLKGIDISHWQQGLDVAKATSSLGLAFCLFKSTQGIMFVDSCAVTFQRQAERAGLVWGMYHFADTTGSAKAQAQWFHKHTATWSGKGIPVLDLEDAKIKDWDAFAYGFAVEYHRLTGIYPMLYVSASKCRLFGVWVSQHMPLWVAGYPKNRTGFAGVGACPYTVAPWKSPVIWQFTSGLNAPGFAGNIDGDVAYVTAAQLHAYSGKSQKVVESGENVADKMLNLTALARDVIAGKYGNGETRKKKLGEHCYKLVQSEVNRLVK